MNSWLMTNLVAVWLMPLGLVLVTAAFGLRLARQHPRAGKRLVVGALAATWLLATPWCSGVLLEWLAGAPTDPLQAAPAQAIVVLGGGKYYAAPEYGGRDSVGDMTLIRLRYAVALHRQTAKPILVTGGSPEGSTTSEAETMKAALENEWRVPVHLSEGLSRNTWENAKYSRVLLAPFQVTRIYLVTHAWHMPRARYAFERAGFEVVPAPTRFTTGHDVILLDFLPQAGALRDSTYFCHEILGMLWYRIKS